MVEDVLAMVDATRPSTARFFTTSTACHDDRRHLRFAYHGLTGLGALARNVYYRHGKLLRVNLQTGFH